MSFTDKLSCYELIAQLQDKTLTEPQLLGLINLYSAAMEVAVDKLANLANSREMKQIEKDAYNLIVTSALALSNSVHVGTSMTLNQDDVDKVKDLNDYLEKFDESVRTNE